MFVLDQRHRKTSVMSSVGDDVSVAASEDFEQKKSEYVDGNLKITHILECTREVMCVRFSPDGNLVAVGQFDGIIKIFQTDTGQVVYSLIDDEIKEKRLSVTAIRFKPSHHGAKIEHTHLLIATYVSGTIKYWHYTSGKCVATIDETTSNSTRQTLSFDISPDGESFVTCGADSKLHHYQIETRKLLTTLEPSDARNIMDGHRARVFAVKFFPFQPHSFISGGWDDTVQIWDERVNQHHALRSIYGPHICGDSLDIDVTHNHILTGSFRKNDPLQIWEPGEGKLIKNVPQDNLHHSLLYCCQWLGKENIICGGCDLNMARFIDRGTLNTVGQLTDLPQGVYCIDNDRLGLKPKVAVGAALKVYLLKMDKKP